MAAIRVVTISATYGSGGSVIGPLLAGRLDMPFHDRLRRAAPAEPPQEQASDDERAEAPRRSWLEGLTLLSADWNIPAPRDPEDLPSHLRQLVEQSLREVLAEGRGVVLGRAAALALGRRPGLFHVRLDGPADRRAERGAAWEGCDVDTARRRLQDTDSLRDRYARDLYRCDAGDPRHYHLVLDTTVLSIDDAVDVVARAAEAAWSFDGTLTDEQITAAKGRLGS